MTIKSTSKAPKFVDYWAGPNVPTSIALDSPLRNACYLCGRTKEALEADIIEYSRKNEVPLEIEHVTPKTLFRPRAASRYIMLWACSRCNRLKGLDDRYIPPFLASTSSSDAAREMIEKTIQTYTSSPRQALLHDLTNRVGESETFSPGGIYLGRQSIIKVSEPRLHRFLKRVAFGIWSRNTGTIRNIENYSCRIAVTDIHRHPEHIESDFTKEFLSCSRFIENWSGVFTYFGSQVTGVDASMWSFWLYEAFHAFVVLHHNELTFGNFSETQPVPK